MLTVYGLAYYHKDYILRSIRSIRETASEPIRFVICHNKSPNSAAITAAVLDILEPGDILLNFWENLKGQALLEGYKYTRPVHTGELFNIFTDLDLIVQDFDWIWDSRNRQENCSLTGFDLDLINYVPPNSGHDPAGLGGWMMGITDILAGKLIDRSITFTDSNIICTNGRFNKSPQQLYHLGWDLWKDDPEYFNNVKVPGVDWLDIPEDRSFRRFDRR